MKKIVLLITIVLALSCCKQTDKNKLADAQPVRQIPIEIFFRKPQQSGYRISPDGKAYIFRAPVNGINNIFIKRIGKSEPIQLTNSTDRDIMRFYWGTDKIILYKQDTE